MKNIFYIFKFFSIFLKFATSAFTTQFFLGNLFKFSKRPVAKLSITITLYPFLTNSSDI